MKNQFFTLSCFIALTSILQLHAMEHNGTEEPPSYESLVHAERGSQTDDLEGMHTSLVRAEIGTQTDAPEEIQASMPSSSLQAIASSSTATQHTISPFDESDKEYKKFLTNARKDHSEKTFLDLINAAHKGDHKVAKKLLKSSRCPEVGTLPLRAAIQGGSLKTVEAIIPFFTPKDAQALLTEPLLYGYTEIFISISEHSEFDYKLPDCRKILEEILVHETVNQQILEHMVSRGLSCKPCIKGLRSSDGRPDNIIAQELIETSSPLYMAIKANNPVAVKYFLKKISLPFTIVFFRGISSCEHECYDSFLNAAKKPLIKKMLMKKKESLQEIQSDLEEESLEEEV